jgi:hypothetical protein
VSALQPKAIRILRRAAILVSVPAIVYIVQPSILIFGALFIGYIMSIFVEDQKAKGIYVKNKDEWEESAMRPLMGITRFCRDVVEGAWGK